MFQNREEAGKLLVQKLIKYKDKKEVLVLAIPRGGVMVGKEIADNLHLPLSVVVVKKLGAPFNPELAIGALAPSGVKVINKEMVERLGISQEYLEREIKTKGEEIREKEEKFSIFNFQFSKYKTFILVDDGIATGATTLAGIKYLKKVSGVRCQVSESNPKVLKAETCDLKPKVILAVPVIASDTYHRLRSEVDEIVALEIPEFFGAVGEFYRQFPQVTDEEVMEYLK